MFNTSETQFVNVNHRNKIEVIYPSAELTIGTKLSTGGISSKTKYFVTVERLLSENLLQVRLTDFIDRTKMFLSTIDLGNFESLKQDQSLHVTFSGFTENLLSIIRSCRKGDLFASLNLDGEQSMLQFYEVRSFRNLIHLYLPITEAPKSVVLHHLNKTLDTLQRQQTSYETTVQHMQHEISGKDAQIHSLRAEVGKLNANLTEQQKILYSRNNEEILSLQQTIQNLTDSRAAEEARLNEIISNLKAKIVHQNKEMDHFFDQKNQELRKSEALREEICILKSNFGNTKEQNEKLTAELATLRNLERKNEVHNEDLRKQVHDLVEKLKKYDKLKSELQAELEAEKNVCRSKRNALQIATEEISKANDIIMRQTRELANLRKTIDWRTEVALQQEMAIREKEKNIIEMREHEDSLERQFNLAKEETYVLAEQLNGMKLLAQQIENRYSEKLSDLTKKFELTTGADIINGVGAHTRATSRGRTKY